LPRLLSTPIPPAVARQYLPRAAWSAGNQWCVASKIAASVEVVRTASPQASSSASLACVSRSPTAGGKGTNRRSG